MATRTKSIGLLAASAMLVLSLVLSPVLSVAKAAPAERKVKVGLASVYSGPLATLGTRFGNAVFDYVRYVNGQGGIDGVEVEIIWRETKGYIPEDVLAIRRLAAQGAVMVFGTPADGAIVTAAQRVGVPVNWVDAMIPACLSTPQWFFCWYIDWPVGLLAVLEYFKGTWPEERPLRLGFMGYEMPATYGTLDAINYKDGAYLDKLGVELVGYETFPFIGCIDTSTEWLRLAGKKPDLVYLTSFGVSTTVAVKDAARLGIQQKGITLAAGPQSIDLSTIAIARKDVNGWYTLGLPWPSDPEQRKLFPGLEVLVEKEKEYRGREVEDVSGWEVGGWVAAAVGLEAIRIALEEVGYENLTGRAVRDALFGGEIKDFDTGCIPPITVTEEHPYFLDRGVLCQIREGRAHFIKVVKALPSFCMSPEELLRAL